MKGQHSECLFIAGELQSVDGYMNIALEKTAEYVNGQLRRNYGDAFVRGNNGVFSCTSEHRAASLTDTQYYTFPPTYDA